MWVRFLIAAMLLAAAPTMVRAQPLTAEEVAFDERAAPLIRYRAAHLALQYWEQQHPGEPLPLLSNTDAARMIRTAFDEAWLVHFPLDDLSAVNELCALGLASTAQYVAGSEDEILSHAGELSYAYSFQVSCAAVSARAATALVATSDLARTPNRDAAVRRVRDRMGTLFVSVLQLVGVREFAWEGRARMLESAARNADEFATVISVAQREQIIEVVDEAKRSTPPAAIPHLNRIRQAMSRTECAGLCAY